MSTDVAYTTPGEYICYLIASDAGLRREKTYIGVTNNSVRRLRQHNGEIAGGAKATRARQWHYVVKVGHFDHQDALRIEWAWKHTSRGRYGVLGRIRGLNELVCQEKWTSKSPPAEERPCTVHVFQQFFDTRAMTLPSFSGLPTHVNVTFHAPVVEPLPMSIVEQDEARANVVALSPPQDDRY
jgi:predicted GIY-YIG superfamily endonuclease